MKDKVVKAASLALIMATGVCVCSAYSPDLLVNNFINPSLEFSTRPFWELGGNGAKVANLTVEGINKQMEQEKLSARYGGFTILPVGETRPVYMTDKYFAMYGEILKKAKDEGLKVTLYDEKDFPSGQVNTQFKKQYPQSLAKQLFLQKVKVSPTGTYTVPTNGELMALIAFNKVTKERVNLISSISNGIVNWTALNGNSDDWEVQFYICKVNSNSRIVDYLDPDAVTKLISFTYDQYYSRFSEYFGNVIDYAFFDDVGLDDISLVGDDGARMWSPSFDKLFVELYGEDPDLYYPALWVDIGAETDSARAKLFNCRAELLARGYPGVVSKWCDDHGIKLMGHAQSPNTLVPPAMTGDLMKFYKYTSIPLIDDIFNRGYAQQSYKIAASASYNYDKVITGTETFGAFPDVFEPKLMYQIVMDQYARGINFIVPHATWYRADAYRIPPLLSYQSKLFGPELGSWNEYVSRMNVLLQGGRHVSDIGVLYPIDSMESWYNFEIGMRKVEGSDYGRIYRNEKPYNDYMEWGEVLSSGVKKDFTYIHPETLDDKITINKGSMKLENTVNFEEYKVFIIPGSTLISLSNLNKIKEFYDKGGVVIASSQLPYKAAEGSSNDAEVVRIINEIFGVNPTATLYKDTKDSVTKNSNNSGGKSYFIYPASTAVKDKFRPEYLNVNLIKSVIDEAIPVYDVNFVEDGITKLKDGYLSYIHKNKDDTDIYFVSNSSNEAVERWIEIRGKITPQLWDPHSGAIITPEFELEKKNNVDITRINLKLSAISSIFIVDESKMDKSYNVDLLLKDDLVLGSEESWNMPANVSFGKNTLSLSNISVVLSKVGGDWANYTLTSNFTLSTGSAGFLFRALDDQNYYLWKLDGSNLTKSVFENGIERVIGSTPMPIVKDINYRIRVDLNGDQINTFIGASLMDTTSDSTFKLGKIGFSATDGTASFSKLIVTSAIRAVEKGIARKSSTSLLKTVAIGIALAVGSIGLGIGVGKFIKSKSKKDTI